MDNSIKDWLVRTKTGEILGPFSQVELFEELQRKTFSADDEICPAGGYWVSAQGLSTRERDEYTLTSTRTATVNRSYSTVSTAKALKVDDEEELTPTPDFNDDKSKPDGTPSTQNRLGIAPSPDAPTTNPKSILSRNKTIKSALKIGVGVAVIGLTFSSLFLFRGKKPNGPLAKARLGTAGSSASGVGVNSEKIQRLIDRGDAVSALNELSSQYEKQPQSLDNESLIAFGALLSFQRESFTRSREILDKVLQSPTLTREQRAKIHHWIGYGQLIEGEGDLGEGQFLEALQLNPQEAATQFNLGRIYLKKDRFQEALEYLQLAELKDPDLWLVHIFKGRARVSLGQSEEAQQAFRAAIAASPDRWLPYFYYALFLQNLHRNEEAQATLERMLQKDPFYEVQSPAPFGFFQEAINYEEYSRAVNRIFEKSAMRREYARLYLGFLTHGNSGAEAKKIESLAQMESVPFKLLGLQVRLDRKASPAELKSFWMGLPENLEPFGYYAYVTRGMAKLASGMAKEAIADFNSALTMEPKAACALYGEYLALKQSRNYVEAQDTLKTLLNYHPNYIPAIVSAQ